MNVFCSDGKLRQSLIASDAIARMSIDGAEYQLIFIYVYIYSRFLFILLLFSHIMPTHLPYTVVASHHQYPPT